MSIFWFIIIGIAAGWLAGQIVKGGSFGLIGDLVVGVIGGVIGGYLLGQAGIFPSGILGSIITATIGAVVLLFVLRLIRRR
jgi:uncharacterized membrane protein YeaQ/YmgE (transglycosylase-associated protein family)